jgi:hypothetical protein
MTGSGSITSATEKYAKKTFDVTQANVEKMNKFIKKDLD